MEVITLDYRKGSVDLVRSIDAEAAIITKELELVSRVQRMSHQEVRFSLKDHKEGFPT